jgi:DNA-binding NarL/FixJ family response regulator
VTKHESWNRRPLRLLIVDDHVWVRDGLRRLIDDEHDMQVVDEASDGRDGARLARALRPTVVLMDGSMPLCGGVEATQIITQSCPEVLVIAVTRNDDASFVRAMLSAGAAGYVLKQNASSELVRAVRAVVRGERYIDRSLRTPATAGIAEPAIAHQHEALTSDEERVLRLVAAFQTNQEIAAMLSLAIDDVAEVRSNGMQKLGLASRLQLRRYAEGQGW